MQYSYCILSGVWSTHLVVHSGLSAFQVSIPQPMYPKRSAFCIGICVSSSKVVLLGAGPVRPNKDIDVTKVSPTNLKVTEGIQTIELRDLNKVPYYWINEAQLYSALNGTPKNSITKEEALYIAKNHMQDDLVVASIEQINEVGKHHEYREKLLPAFVISYNHDEELKTYVSIKDGKLQTVRHRSWRWFDFLWMTHTMDYEGRDNFNTIVLRAFSLLGLITVLSGFLLWYTSSLSIRKLLKRIKKNKT